MGFKYTIPSVEVFGFSAEIPVNINTIDNTKLKALEKHDNLINKLDEWVLCPDKRLLPYLTKLAK